ncbi:MAG: tetraacyldisaccharide 4'-kinase [Reinekea sp.]|nr:tetraacyldisaccharide 4'-kinase [Reinekea sp.]
MKFWYHSKLTIAALLLMPFSLITLIVSLFKRKFRSRHSYAVPVVVIGNLTVGGTGKTPTIIWLVNLLQSRDYRVAVVSRGYGAKPNQSFPILIADQHSAFEVGDEPTLIRNKTSADVVIDPDRDRAVRYLSELPLGQRPDVIISDDGMQHYRMARDIEILMIDPLRGFGNGLLLPAGPLRELPSRLRSVDYVLAKQKGPELPEGVVHTASVKTDMPINAQGEILAATQVHLCSAIGNIQSFIDTMIAVGFSVKVVHDFRDHQRLPDRVLSDKRLPIVVTEKDFVKLLAPADHIYFLPYGLEYSDEFKRELLTRIEGVFHEKSSHYSG